MRVLVIAVVAAIVGGGAVYGALLYLGQNPVQVSVQLLQDTPSLAPESPPSPTDALPPTATALATAVPPTVSPTATLGPTRTVASAPNRTPIPTLAGPTEREIVVNAFAECNGTHSGEEKRRRFAATNSAIDRDLRSVASIRALVKENCGGVFPMLTAAAQPAVTPTPLPTATKTPVPNYTPRPIPTVSVPLSALHSMQNTRWVRQSHPGLYNSIIDLPWVADGLSESEKEAIEELLYIAVRDVGIANDLGPVHTMTAELL